MEELLEEILNEGMNLIHNPTNDENRNLWKEKYYDCIDKYILILTEMKNLDCKMRSLSSNKMVNMMEKHFVFARMIIRANGIFNIDLKLDNDTLPDLSGINLVKEDKAIDFYLSKK